MSGEQKRVLGIVLIVFGASVIPVAGIVSMWILYGWKTGLLFAGVLMAVIMMIAGCFLTTEWSGDD